MMKERRWRLSRPLVPCLSVLTPSRLRSVLCPDSFLNPRAEGYLAMA
ncbi:unnamed protein product [Ixodes pacificus]